MFDFSKLSAAKLVAVYNAIADGPAVKKFETQARALERLSAAMAKRGYDADQTAQAAGLLPTPAPVVETPRELPTEPRAAVELVSGEVVQLRQTHGALRAAKGDPKKAAKAAAAAAVAAMPHRQAQQAPVKAAEARSGALRSNAAVPALLAALRRPGGATLAELTQAAGWRAPVLPANLRILSRKQGVAVVHDGKPVAERRYQVQA